MDGSAEEEEEEDDDESMEPNVVQFNAEVLFRFVISAANFKKIFFWADEEEEDVEEEVW